MKKVIKYFLVIIASLIVLLAGFVVWAFWYFTQDTVIDLPIDHKAGRPFTIPVEINGKTYSFVWDTGAWMSTIDYKLASELGYQGILKKYHKISAVRHIAVDTFAYDSLPVKLGGIELKELFLLDGYRKYAVTNDSISNYNTSTNGHVGIIGQNIISRYRWLFDFKERKLRMANHEFTIPQEPGDSIVKFNFTHLTPTIKTPRIDLCINKRDTFRFVFDTGYRAEQPFALLDSLHDVGSSFIFSDSLTAFVLRNAIGTTLTRYSGGRIDAIGLDTLLINDVMMNQIHTGRNVRHHDRDTVNYITAYFPCRFRLMYYDPKKKEVSFYVSPQDSTFIYGGEDEKRLFNETIDKLLNGNFPVLSKQSN